MPDLIIGRHPVLEALQAGTLIEKIIISAHAKGKPVDDIKVIARQRNIPFKIEQEDVLAKLSGDARTQGVVAFIGTKHYSDISDILAIAEKRNEKPFIIVFDEIEDPHNLGALIRSALCFGAHGGIIPKHHAASVNQTVTKTSAGASEYFPIAKVTNISATLDELREAGVWIFGADASSENSPSAADFRDSVALVIGNEGRGIRRLVKEKCDFLVRIPMAGSFDSLNASVAGAILMYEVMLSRTKK